MQLLKENLEKKNKFIEKLYKLLLYKKKIYLKIL